MPDSPVLGLRYAADNLPSDEPSDTLYITGLPSPSVDEDDLKLVFVSLGLTVRRLETIPDTEDAGTSAAIVQVASQDEASRAISEIDGQDATSLSAAITEDIAEQGTDDKFMVVRYAGNHQMPSDNLYLSGLPSPAVDQADLKNLFTSNGFTVVRMRVMPDIRKDGYSSAMVQVKSADEAAKAIAAFSGQSSAGLKTSDPSGGAPGASRRADGSGPLFLVKYAGSDPSAASDNLYITGLPTSIDQASLNQMFTSKGFTVARSRVNPDSQGRGCTTAMVQVASQQEAAKAIEAFSGQDPLALAGQVAGAAKRPPPAAEEGASSLQVRYAGHDNVPSDNLYLCGLSSATTDQTSLNEMFTGLGLTVVRSRTIPDTRGNGRMAAMVQVASREEAALAIEKLHGQPVEIQPGQGAAKRPRIDGFPLTSAQPMLLTVKYAGDGETPSDNLYLAGLPSPAVSQADLTQVFVGLGLTVVRSRVMPDTQGRGYSTAMVQLGSQEEASQAIQTLNGEDASALATTEPVAVQRFGGKSTVLGVKYAGQEQTPSDNLYITGLPSPGIHQGNLDAIFRAAGFTVVRSRLLPDTKGIGSVTGMVQLGSQEEAALAIEALHGQEGSILLAGAEAAAGLPAAEPAAVGGGLTLTVKYAGQDSTVPSDNLYISGLPSPAADQADLHKVFQGLGLTVVRSRILPDTKGHGMSSAMVQVQSREEAATAIEILNGQDASAIGVVGGSSAPNQAAIATYAAPAAAYAAPAAAAGPHTMTVRYAGKEETPSDNLYIAGLPSPAVELTELNAVFVGLGLTVVRSRVMADTYGNGSSAAMVQVASQEEAARAIQELSGQDCSALAPAAAPQAKINGASHAGGMLQVRFAGAEQTPSDNLYLAGLPSASMDQNSLNEIFAFLGFTVVRSRVNNDTWGNGKCSAMVQLQSKEEACAAIQALNGTDPSLMVAEPGDG
eukprot:CAMPEP_0179251120 /NCGR_PEP_ID=MMETSP0797-20121207/21524_1 /TAXON_ID=47934 /ORGANISM="Dinophysis acuminata, Strain DAEP01" /LENGTH=950 /DNA_ID=CAMNT_0020958887 /DNA_START=91 /DNA_END=2940 /DNA_ORIENTATION=-